MTRIVVVAAVAALSSACLAGSPGLAPAVTAGGRTSYGWPVRPFFRQHPVRGIFGDPRIGPDATGRIVRSLHTGVDVVAADGTPVYATISGSISLHPLHHDVVVVTDGSGRAFEYWHVLPTTSLGRATAYETVIGHVEWPWAHVNFAERRGSTYVNPLRPGAMEPYTDSIAPRILHIRFERDGAAAGRTVSGTMDLVVDAYDPPTLPVSAPWDRIRLAPAEIRWRLLDRRGRALTGWRIAFDARGTLPTTSYPLVYAEGTRQNRPSQVGSYRFYLARSWSAASLRDGRYAVEVAALDIRGNETRDRLRFNVSEL